MYGGSDPRWDDPRERDDDPRDIDVHWIKIGRGPSEDPLDDDPRQRDDDPRDRDRDARDRDHDPRDVFLRDLELPRGLERELVLDRDHRYELNREDSRTLGATGAFRVVSESDLKKTDYPHLTFGDGDSKTVRYFPDKVPIGAERNLAGATCFGFHTTCGEPPYATWCAPASRSAWPCR